MSRVAVYQDGDEWKWEVVLGDAITTSRPDDPLRTAADAIAHLSKYASDYFNPAIQRLIHGYGPAKFPVAELAMEMDDG